jgi:hypothetical protein
MFISGIYFAVCPLRFIHFCVQKCTKFTLNAAYTDLCQKTQFFGVLPQKCTKYQKSDRPKDVMTRNRRLTRNDYFGVFEMLNYAFFQRQLSSKLHKKLWDFTVLLYFRKLLCYNTFRNAINL